MQTVPGPRMSVPIPITCSASFLPLDTSAGEILKQGGITLAGMGCLDAGYHICRANADHHFVLFTLAGAGHVVVETGSRDLNPGELLVAPAHTTYTCGAKEAPWHAIWFHLANTHFWGSINRMGFCVRRSQAAELVLHTMEQFLHETLSGEAESDRLAELHAAAILAYLDREFAAGMVGRRQLLQRRLAKLRDDLSTHLGRRWTVRDMAREAMLSPTHLTRLCHELFQTTPSHMLSQLRMQRARALLGETSFKLGTIAGMVGYGDTFAFSAAFKRMCGTSPSLYRERQAGSSAAMPPSG
jgi:AraC family transcriptional regulator of arabinose operon